MRCCSINKYSNAMFDRGKKELTRLNKYATVGRMQASEPTRAVSTIQDYNIHQQRSAPDLICHQLECSC